MDFSLKVKRKHCSLHACLAFLKVGHLEARRSNTIGERLLGRYTVYIMAFSTVQWTWTVCKRDYFQYGSF